MRKAKDQERVKVLHGVGPNVSGTGVQFNDSMVQPAPTKETKMSETAAENMNGNAELGDKPATTEVDESPVKAIRRAWEAAGAVFPSKEDGEKLKNAYRKAKADLTDATAAEAAARKRLSDVAKLIMEKTGGQTITIDGVDHIPSVHGQSYFYRVPGSREKKEKRSL